MVDKIKELETKLSSPTDVQTKIDLLNDLAWELRDTDPHRSRDLSETAHQLSTAAPFDQEVYRPGVIASLRGLAHSNRRAGNLTLALSQAMQALTYLESATLPSIETDILQNIAIILGSLGNYAEALEYGFKALGLAQSLGDHTREAHILSSIGVIYIHSKNIDASLDMFRQALQLERKLGDKRYEGQTLNNLSLSYHAQGDYKQALMACLDALRIAQENDFQGLIVTATGTVGETYLGMGEYTQANQYLEKYLVAARSTESKRDEASALILLGETAQRQQQTDSALSYLSQALVMAQQVGLRSEQARCHELLAEMYEQQGDLKQALAQLRLYYQVKETLFNEDAAKKIANLQVIHQVETTKRDAEIHYLKTIELQREIEERKKSEAALEVLAAIDPLTQVLNRRKFFDLAEGEIQNALRRHKPLSTILLDLDHFKAINDKYGHSIGDRLLTTVARLIRDNLRDGEIIGRIGGDEFAILLPGHDLIKSRRIAQRLQEKIATYPFEMDQETFLITTSLGVAELDRENESSFSVLLDHADKAMYSAKQSGRNCVGVYQPRSRP